MKKKSDDKLSAKQTAKSQKDSSEFDREESKNKDTKTIGGFD